MPLDGIGAWRVRAIPLSRTRARRGLVAARDSAPSGPPVRRPLAQRGEPREKGAALGRRAVPVVGGPAEARLGELAQAVGQDAGGDAAAAGLQVAERGRWLLA